MKVPGVFTGLGFDDSWDLFGVEMEQLTYFFEHHKITLQNNSSCKYKLSSTGKYLNYEVAFLVEGTKQFTESNEWYFSLIINASPEMLEFINQEAFLTTIKEF